MHKVYAYVQTCTRTYILTHTFVYSCSKETELLAAAASIPLTFAIEEERKWGN